MYSFASTPTVTSDLKIAKQLIIVALNGFIEQANILFFIEGFIMAENRYML